MAALHRSQPTLQIQAGPRPAGGQVCAGPRKGLPLFIQSFGGGRYGFGLVPLNMWLLWPPSRATGKSLHTDRAQPRLEFLLCPLNPQGYLLFQSRAEQSRSGTIDPG